MAEEDTESALPFGEFDICDDVGEEEDVSSLSQLVSSEVTARGSRSPLMQDNPHSIIWNLDAGFLQFKTCGGVFVTMSANVSSEDPAFHSLWSCP